MVVGAYRYDTARRRVAANARPPASPATRPRTTTTSCARGARRDRARAASTRPPQHRRRGRQRHGRPGGRRACRDRLVRQELQRAAAGPGQLVRPGFGHHRRRTRADRRSARRRLRHLHALSRGMPDRGDRRPGVVDARRCLAWHLQATGDFPREFREALGDRIYGCDECQEVCPPSRRSDARTSRSAPTRRRVPRVTRSACRAAWVDLEWMLHGRRRGAARDGSGAGTSRDARPGTCAATHWSCTATPRRGAADHSGRRGARSGTSTARTICSPRTRRGRRCDSGGPTCWHPTVGDAGRDRRRARGDPSRRGRSRPRRAGRRAPHASRRR